MAEFIQDNRIKAWRGALPDETQCVTPNNFHLKQKPQLNKKERNSSSQLARKYLDDLQDFYENTLWTKKKFLECMCPFV